MQRPKVFIASSSELKADRDQIEIFIGRKNIELTKRNRFIELVMWENFLDAMSADGLQSEYNKAIQQCDVFVMLFFTKVGKYTREEFETAFGTFKEGGKPLIYTFFKAADVNISDANKDNLLSVFEFQDRLKELKHYFTVYQNTAELLLKLDGQFDRIMEMIGPKQFSIPNIHKLLEEGISGGELQTLAATHFRKVFNDFLPGQTRGQQILMLLDHVQRRLEVEKLLDLVKELNPAAFGEYAPYW